jgi:hypothetical protein
MYTIKNTTGGCGAKGASGAGIAPPGNPGDVLYLVSSGVAGAASNVLYTGSGNLYAANSVTTTNVFATRYYGDGGLLSNISATFTQPLANLVVSNSVTTTNIFATSANIATMNVGYLTVNSAVVYGTSTLNVYGTSNLTNVTVTDTFNVNGSVTANAANATFFFDTFTIQYINTQVLNVASNIILSGNLSAPLANITTLNVNYLTVNSAVVYGTSTLNVYGVSNLSTATMIGTSGKTTLNVTGNVYASNAVTTTNLFANTATLIGTTGLTSLNVTGNIYASNAVTTTNVFTTNVTATNLTGAGSGITSLNMDNAGSGTLAVARGGTGTTTSTGTGSVVLSAAPTLTGTTTVAGLYASSGDIGFNAVPAGATRSTQRFYVYDPSFCIEIMQRTSLVYGLNFITRNTDGVFSWRKVANSTDWGTELMFLDNSGNLTTTAGITATTLTGAGSGITSLNMGNAGSGTLAVARGGTGTTTSTGTGSVVLSAAPTLTGTTNVATLIASGNITSSSDRRIKKDIKRIEGALDKVTQIGGYTFTRTDGPHTGTIQAGVIAQEIIEVLPEVVQISEETGYYSVSYGNITALLIEALKEERLERLKLEERLTRLEKLNP